MKTFPIDFQWPVQEPFLFCVHHHDIYPKGNSEQALDQDHLIGRRIGQDFELKDGFRTYHGAPVPGFPVHPHRGFETITIVRKGLVDHADSMGASGRYGQGDVQWMTAGSGVQHSEMFPLIHQEQNNELELFQIWLNLPKKSKMTTPHFKMLWSEKIPTLITNDGRTRVQVIAGEFLAQKALPPPPDSWAASSDNEVNILLVKMDSEAKLELPPTRNPSQRSLYFFQGSQANLNNQQISLKSGVFVSGQEKHTVHNTGEPLEFLLLQARPIGEPVVQHGPFVMNTRSEISQTIKDYQLTQFGGWDWPRQDMIHGPLPKRFAKLPDGNIEYPPQKSKS